MARSIHCILLALAASPLLAADAPWRGYAVYQPTIERAVVCDAADQPLRYNHDSSVAWFGDRWFCLWNANAIPEEGAPGQLNYVSTSHDGLTWSAPRPAFSDPSLCVNPVPCLKGTQWQPNLLVVKDQLWCLWSQNSKDEHNGCYLSVLATPDGLWTNRLLTWNGKADPVIEGKPFRLFPTQNPVQLSSGRVLAPITMIGYTASAKATSVTRSVWCAKEKRNSVLYTDDNGTTWRISPGTMLPGLDWRQWEPTVFEQPDGSVMMFARNNLIGPFEDTSVSPEQALVWSLSRDGGATWTPHAFVPLETVVSRMHVLMQPDSDRYLMIHNDWPAGTFCTDRRNLALFVNRGGGFDFTAGLGLTDREPEVAYPQMALHDNALLISYSQGACGLRSIRAVRISPLPSPNQLYLYPRANLPPSPQCVLTNGSLRLSGGLALKCYDSPVIPPDRFNAEAWINPDDVGVLFDNRGPKGGFVWGLSGSCFVHLGDPTKNIRSTLPVPCGRWSRVAVTVNYPNGEVTFSVDGQSERIAFKPGHRSMSGISATLFGPNLASSSLTAFEGSVHTLILEDTNRLFDASDPSALAQYGGRYEPAATRVSETSASVENTVRGGHPVLRFTGAASAGIELDANERSSGDAVELDFAFLIERGDGQTLCTAGDANQPARIIVSGTNIVLRANGQSLSCGSATPGLWQRLALTTFGNTTRVTLDHNPPAEIQHAPQATWLYLGEGYRTVTPPSHSVFNVDVQSVRSRVILKPHNGP